MDIKFAQFRTDQASVLLRAMGNAQRLRILLLLSQRERSVIELETQVGLSQSAVSQHLSKLRQAGLVRAQRQGQMIYYALDGNKVQAILSILRVLYKEKRAAPLKTLARQTEEMKGS